LRPTKRRATTGKPRVTGSSSIREAHRSFLQRLIALQEHAAQLASATNPDEIINHTINAVEYALGFDYADITVVERGWLRTKAFRGAKALPDLELKGPGIIANAANLKRTIRVPDTRKEKSYVQGVRNMYSELAVPVVLEDEVFGVLNVESKHLNAFTDEDQRLLETLASHVASAMARLRKEEAYRTVVQNALQGLTIIQDGRIVFANQALLEMSGYNLDETLFLAPDHVMATVHPEDRERAWMGMRDLLAGKPVLVPQQFRLIRKDGSSRWVETLASRIEYQGKPALQVGYIDITERKQAEERLRENEEQYRLLIERQGQGLGIVDTEERFVYCNPAGEEIFGVPPGELVGRNLREFTTFEAFRVIGKETQNRLGGKSTTYELQIVRPGGEIRHLLVTATPWKDKSGRIVGTTAIFSDETERKRMEGELRESEERFRSLYSTMNEGVCLHEVIYDELGVAVDYRIIDVNPAYESILALKRETVIRRLASEVYGTSKAPNIDIYEQVASTGRPTNFETYFPPMKKHFSISVFSPGKGKFATIFTDITERKQVEERLRESEERYRLLIERQREGLIVVDLEEKVVLCNPAGEEVFGMPPGGLIDRNLSEFTSPTTFEMLKKETQDRIAGKSSTYEVEIARPNGEKRILLAASTPWMDRDGRIVGSLGIFRDITEQKRMEGALRHRAEQLAALQETLLGITGRQDLPKLLNSIIERAAGLLDAAGGGLYLCDPDRREVRCVVAYNTKTNAVGTVLKYGEGAAGVVAQTGKPLIIDDYGEWKDRAAAFEKEKPFSAVLSAPMIWQGEVTGVIHVLRYEAKRFTEQDLEQLATFANHAAIAVENARLYERLDQHATQLERIVNDRTEKLAESESRYRRLFESSPISLWEEDFSQVKRYFDELRAKGTKNFREYFVQHRRKWPNVLGW